MALWLELSIRTPSSPVTVGSSPYLEPTCLFKNRHKEHRDNNFYLHTNITDVAVSTTWRLEEFTELAPFLCEDGPIDDHLQ